MISRMRSAGNSAPASRRSASRSRAEPLNWADTSTASGKNVQPSAAWRVAHVNHVTNGIRVVVPFNKQRADDDIALAAMSSLEWNCLVPETVEVQVAEGWVTLSGSVERQQQKEEAARALCTLNGITGIRNDIVIQPSVSVGDVKASIEAALRRNALVDSSHIKAHVAHGVASLRGTARSRAEYEEAMHAAWAAPGVTKIEDHITIGSVRSNVPA